MRKVLIITGLILVLISCSTNKNANNDQYAGEINGQLIDRSVYTTSFIYNYKKLTKGNPNYQATTKEVNRIEDLTWKELTQNVIISQFIAENNIDVTQEELNDSLLTNPPQVLKESGYFTTKGEFDNNKYRSSILTNEPVNTEYMKYQFYQNITFQKIQHELIKKAEISSSDVKKYYQKNYSTSDIILLSMDLDTYEPTVTNREVELRWEDDSSEYYYEPSLDIKYIIQDIQPTKDEIEQTKSTIDSLYYVLSQGGNFDSAVLEFSSNQGLYPLGKMPFLKLENVPSIINSYVKNSEIGDVISPVVKNNVWYIYKILEKTKTMVKLQELKHPVQISKETIRERREEFMQIGDLIEQIGIDNAGFEYGWEVYSANDLNLTRTFVENLGDLSDLIKDARNKPDGFIYPPIYNKTDRFLVMVQIQQNRLNKKKDLADIFEEIETEILREKQLNLVTNKLRTLADDYKNIDQDKLTDVTYQLIKDVSKDTQFMQKNNDAFIKDILSLSSKGDYSRCFADDESGFIAVLLKHNIANDAYFKQNYYIIQGEYRQNALTNNYLTWLETEIDRAKVKRWFSMKDLYKGSN